MPSETGKLYVAATPIGNLSDISPRLHQTLELADIILAEDTRRAKKLCSHLNIPNALIKRCDNIREGAVVALLDQWFDSGLTLVLVSDAGTPCISDPGWRIVNHARSHNIEVLPIAGPSSVTSALSVSGFPVTPFTFYGFLEKKKSKSAVQLQNIFDCKHASVFFESKYRIEKTLGMMLELDPTRHIMMIREMTKAFEQSLYGTVADISQNISQLKGEWTIVVSPNHDRFRT